MRGLWSIPLLGPLTFAAWKIDARRKLKWMKAHLGKTDSHIDIGNGPGSLLSVMRDQDYQIDGLDITDSAYRRELTAQIYDGHAMPFDAGAYDTALLSTMLHHTPDPDHILRESVRIANRLIIIEDVYNGPVMEWLTKRFDSLMNLEFKGHPHSNRTDAQWKATFAQMNMRLVSAQIYPVAGIFRQAVYVIEPA